MTKEKQYEIKVRSIAADLQEGMGFTMVVLEEISLRGEKTILKNLIKKYERQVEENNLFEMDNTQNQNVLTVLTSRQTKVNSF